MAAIDRGNTPDLATKRAPRDELFPARLSSCPPSLTDAQREAIAYRGGHLRILACAGSGKTEVVARRIADLLDPKRLDPLQPRNIVAFTFTEGAAAELKARIVRRVRETRGVVLGLAEMFVGTIHAFCGRLLQEEVPEFLRYEVLDEARQLMLLLRECGLDAGGHRVKPV